LQHLPDYSRREIEYLVTHEKVVHLDDFLLRRSLVSMLGGGSHAMIAELADVVGDALGWDTDHRQAEVERTTHILTTNHKMML
jgi:glycerol-3-phosphate dehydrogenase